MRAFLDHQRSDLLLASGDLALFAGAAAGEQLRIELLQVSCLWQRYPVIAPEVAGLAFDPAFLVRFRRVAKVAVEPPVRAEGDEARSLLAPMAAQDLLYRTLQ